MEEEKYISQMAHEKDCARLERVIHRLWILCFIMFLTLAITNYMWWRYESQFDVVEEVTEQTVTQDVDTGRFGDAVVAGIGDIHNGESKTDGNNEDHETLSQKEEEKIND